MKKMFLLAGILATVMFVSCSKDEKKEEAPATSYQFKSTEKIEAKNIEAGKGRKKGERGTAFEDFLKFNFSENKIVEGDNWDIAFKGTTIIVNGGTPSDPKIKITGKGAIYVTDGTLESVTSAEFEKLKQNSLNNFKEWATYTGHPTHLIKATPGKILVIRTHDEKFVKLRIDSYYQNKADLESEASHLTTKDKDGYFTFTFIKG
ncbi:HmuY family protein [Capnocytophaga canis]|uniref:HmuY protein n=1 Tax=Capnocytophaga canis TaxID=1848903 RepID=A0A3A1YDN7_9FLAO|nr:HmuY family protein [Capnocytophaga canis]RIY36272.1 hypothetical protein CKY20_07210 [Capnocytophaga canis]GIM60976.1 hypothetical protein CAPN008_10260 [Capnocytophaga canis]